jgi:hypothetical protein
MLSGVTGTADTPEARADSRWVIAVDDFQTSESKDNGSWIGGWSIPNCCVDLSYELGFGLESDDNLIRVMRLLSFSDAATRMSNVTGYQDIRISYRYLVRKTGTIGAHQYRSLN